MHQRIMFQNTCSKNSRANDINRKFQSCGGSFNDRIMEKKISRDIEDPTDKI